MEAFNGCVKLLEVDFSAAMFAENNEASIGASAFHSCTSLVNIYLPTSANTQPKTKGTNVFGGVPTNGFIYYSSGKSKIANDFQNDFSLTS
jgi:hypothetical protein